LEIVKASYGPYRLASAEVVQASRDPLALLDVRPWPPDIGVQFIRPELVASERHLVAAFYAAATTMIAGTARSRRIEVELLLKLTGRTQILDALNIAGLRGGETRIIVAVISGGAQDPADWVVRVAGLLGGRLQQVSQASGSRMLLEIFAPKEARLRAIPRSSYADPLELLLIENVVASYIE
jgi:hypothetical protein